MSHAAKMIYCRRAEDGKVVGRCRFTDIGLTVDALFEKANNNYISFVGLEVKGADAPQYIATFDEATLTTTLTPT